MKFTTALRICIFFLAVLPAVRAQIRPDSLANRIPAHLRAIERAPGSTALGAVYYYGEQRLRSPFSLEIPFYELGDPEVRRQYRVFKTFNSISQLTALVPLGYLLFQPKNQRVRTREYWYVYIGSIVASVGLSIGGNVKVSQAVRRYNKVLLEKRLGVSMAPVPATGRTAVGLGVSGRF
ncbi:hypothetical protein [Tellurirhabdus rosea]|uniref:hypothetical protein n=1 Tax=Tellurirhabdus rosea TaxID=2674997 RepID=UPI002258A9EE|nr:hypothetical protein [Tellurirhabdus rosea]